MSPLPLYQWYGNFETPFRFAVTIAIFIKDAEANSLDGELRFTTLISFLKRALANSEVCALSVAVAVKFQLHVVQKMKYELPLT